MQFTDIFHFCVGDRFNEFARSTVIYNPPGGYQHRQSAKGTHMVGGSMYSILVLDIIKTQYLLIEKVIVKHLFHDLPHEKPTDRQNSILKKW